MGKLTELRSLLSALAREMGRKGAPSREIVSAFRKKYPDVVTRDTDYLVSIALTKIVSDVRNRRPRGIAVGQLELFGEYGVPAMIAIRVDHKSGARYVNKALTSTTIAEANQYLDDHAKPRKISAEERKELRRLVKDVEPFKKSDASTIDECWAALQAKKKTA